MQEALTIHQLRRYPWQEGMVLAARIQVEGASWAHQTLVPPHPPSDLHLVCFGGGGGSSGKGTHGLLMRFLLPREEASAQLGSTTGPFMAPAQAGSSAQRAWLLWVAGLVWDFHASENHREEVGQRSGSHPASGVISPSVPGQGWVLLGALMKLFAHEGSPPA